MSEATARSRMIQSAMLLMAEHGVEATSFSQVVEHSGAPRGSIYHHFPDGKAQLVAEATRFSGDFLAQALAGVREQRDPRAGLEAAAGFWRDLLGQTDFAVGCPVVAVTVSGERSPGARDAANEVFALWRRLHMEVLVDGGVPEARARSLAAIFVAAMEGGILLARAERSLEPLDRVVDELRSLLDEALRESR